MKVIRITLSCLILFFSFWGNTQTKTAEYLAIINELNLQDMRHAMSSVGSHGLNPLGYWTTAMETAYQTGQNSVGGVFLRDMANQNYLRLLKDISIGTVDPVTMGKDVRLLRKEFLTPAQLRTLALAQAYKAWPLLEQLAPLHAPYISLKESLQKISAFCANNAWPVLPALKAELKMGTKNPQVTAIKTRLQQFGYKVTVDDTFDAATLAAVKDIQWLMRKTPDGVISPGGRTWLYLNKSCQDRLRQVRLDMEKLRWFPQVFEERFIFVNLAMSYFNMIDRVTPGAKTMSFRTINGRISRPSPMLKDKVVQVILNPFWVVPPTIFREDKVEDIRKLAPWEIDYYFDSHNYEVWNKDFTRRISPSSIDWQRLDAKHDADFYIRQKPHTGNALGIFKFMLTNSFAIYLHDTNQRELFAEPDRLISSGCVRVERPLDLAEYLLRGTQWTREVIERTVAKPGEVLNKDTPINLKQPVPVYMAFLTSHYDASGIIRFTEDSYGQDKRLIEKGVW
ncbi:MAG: L,D-transpeptidase family protein [Bdellovibrio sp.]|nr:L,D-transpeptidase family protein [Bdellovibrio sp.]